MTDIFMENRPFVWCAHNYMHEHFEKKIDFWGTFRFKTKIRFLTNISIFDFLLDEDVNFWQNSDFGWIFLFTIFNFVAKFTLNNNTTIIFWLKFEFEISGAPFEFRVLSWNVLLWGLLHGIFYLKSGTVA